MSDLFDPNRLRSIWENRELWSCLGFEGLSIAFDIPVDDLTDLAEEEKMRLMSLLSRLTMPVDEVLKMQIQHLEGISPKERLTRIRELVQTVVRQPK